MNKKELHKFYHEMNQIDFSYLAVIVTDLIIIAYDAQNRTLQIFYYYIRIAFEQQHK